MRSLKTLREKLGVSQKQMADYLSLTRSQVSLAEIDLRSIPTRAMLKMAAIEKLLTDTNLPAVKNKPTAAIKKADLLYKKRLESSSSACSIKAKQLAGKLERMQIKYAQAHKILQVTEHLLSQLPATKEKNKDKIWLEILEAEALKKVQLHNTNRQLALQLKMNVLKFEAAEILKMVNKIG